MAATKPSKPGKAPASPVDDIETVRATAEGAGEAMSTVTEAEGPVAHAVVDSGRAQALSMAMVDAAGHLRRVETLSLAAMARGLEAILAGDTENGAATLEAAEATLDKAIERLARLVTLSGAESSD